MPTSAPIDRRAWASTLLNLIAVESAGNKTKFAETVGVNRKTINRWLGEEVAVSAESIRAIAAVLGISDRDLLLRVGHYRAEDITVGPGDVAANAAVTDGDPALDLIRAADLPPSVRRELLEDFAERMKVDAQRRLEDAQRQIDRLRRGRRRTA